MSNPDYFIEKPTKEELRQLYNLTGKTGGDIFVGRIGTTRLSQSPYTSYYDCRLKLQEPSNNALYREKMTVKKENEKRVKDFTNQAEIFVDQTFNTYVFNEKQTDIISAVNRAIERLDTTSHEKNDILIIHSDMIHDLGKPKPYALTIPNHISVHIIGKAYTAKVIFSPDSNITLHDTFNDFLHFPNTHNYENK